MTNLRTLYWLVLLFWIVLLAVAHDLTGQTRVGDIVVDVPFSFVAGGQALPPGHYTVEALDETRIRIFNRDMPGAIVSTHAVRRGDSNDSDDNNDSKLVFHRYGDTYFLSALWVRGNQTGRGLFPTRAERELSSRQVEMQLAMVRPPK